MDQLSKYIFKLHSFYGLHITWEQSLCFAKNFLNKLILISKQTQDYLRYSKWLSFNRMQIILWGRGLHSSVLPCMYRMSFQHTSTQKIMILHDTRTIVCHVKQLQNVVYASGQTVRRKIKNK